MEGQRSQFHYGSITTKDLLLEYQARVKSQFHYGSITTYVDLESSEYAFEIVSIPLWFDYN